MEAFISYVLKDIKLTVRQNGMGKPHHLAVGFVRIEDTGAHSAYVFGKTHDQLFSDRVDSGVGYLCKLLAEIVEEYLRFARQDSQRRVISHRGCGLLTTRCHWYERVFYVFFAEAELYFLGVQVLNGVAYLASGMDFFELNAVRVQPLAVGMRMCELLLYFTIVVYFALLRVDKQYLSGLQTPFFDDL